MKRARGGNGSASGTVGSGEGRWGRAGDRGGLGDGGSWARASGVLLGGARGAGGGRGPGARAAWTRERGEKGDPRSCRRRFRGGPGCSGRLGEPPACSARLGEAPGLQRQFRGAPGCSASLGEPPAALPVWSMAAVQGPRGDRRTCEGRQRGVRVVSDQLSPASAAAAVAL